MLRSCECCCMLRKQDEVWQNGLSSDTPRKMGWNGRLSGGLQLLDGFGGETGSLGDGVYRQAHLFEVAGDIRYAFRFAL